MLDALRVRRPEQEFVVRVVTTLGDRVADVPLSRFASTGVFVREIDRLLLDGEIDLAVHSLKDVPPDETPGTLLAAFPERADPRDVIVSRCNAPLADLPPGARVGTSSTRRLAQLRRYRPDLTFAEDLRGNVDTRLRKLRQGDYDAIVLAAAGLIRLGRGDEITEYLSTSVCLPDAGQGTLVVQCRRDDAAVAGLVAQLDDPLVRAASLAERAVLRAFGGGCKVPVAAYARVEGETLVVEGLVGRTDGSRLARATVSGSVGDPEALGGRLWDELARVGAREILGEAVDV